MDDPHQLTRAAEAALRSNRIDEGESLCREVLKLDPNNVQALGMLADSRLKRGDRAEGLALLEAAIRLRPDDLGMRLFGARAFGEGGDLETAELHALRAVELAPQNGTALLQYALILQVRGEWRRASDLLLRAVQAQPNNAMAYWAFARSNKITEADRPWVDRLESVSAFPGLPPGPRSYLFYALGKAYSDLGYYDRAIGFYHQANRLAREFHFGSRPLDRESLTHVTDRTIEVLSRDFLARNRHLGSPSEIPIFIVGMIRSGTTLVDQIVSSHPEVGSAGELGYWMQQGDRAFTESLDLDPEVTARMQATYLDILRSHAPGKSRIIDKMPHNVGVVGALSVIFPRASIVRLKRNPADNCLSIYTTPFPGPPSYAFDWDSIGFAYRESLRIVRHWREILGPEVFFEVEYERLVADREPETRAIIDHCRLKWDDACLHPESNRRTVNTPSLWQVRQPVYTTSIERWKRYAPWLAGIADLAELPN